MTATVGSLATALRPADSQLVFRAVLEALARPGTAMALPSGPLRMLAPAMVPVFALADLGTGVCVLDNEIPPSSGEFEHWADAIATATSAPLWPAELARLVAALRPVTDEEVRSFCRGTPEAPEDAALVSLAVADVDGGTAVGGCPARVSPARRRWLRVACPIPSSPRAPRRSAATRRGSTSFW